jgi:hypothetical protein
MKLSDHEILQKSQINKFLFYFNDQYPVIKPQGFIKSEIQGKLQTSPTNFSLSNQEVSMKKSKLIDKSFKVNMNPTNLSEMNLRSTKNKTVPKRFPIPKIPKKHFQRNPKKKIVFSK